MINKNTHIPVLLEETIRALSVKNDEFYVEIFLDKTSEIYVVVYNLLGKKVNDYSTQKPSGKHVLESDFNLKSGNYIVSILKDNVEIRSEKLIIR